MRNRNEQELIDALHKKRKLEPKVEAEFAIFQKILPALRALIKAGGTPDQLFKKSSGLAAYKIIELLNSDKEDIVMKAAEKVIAYDIGKPVERTLNIYGDISKMNESDIDQQILHILGSQSGTRKLIETTLGAKPKRRLQRRKPRNSEPITIEANERPTSEAQVIDVSGETTTPRNPQN